MSNKQNALQVSFVALYQPTALYVGTLGRSPTCLTSCPFVALYVGNLQPWEVPKIPHKLFSQPCLGLCLWRCLLWLYLWGCCLGLHNLRGREKVMSTKSSKCVNELIPKDSKCQMLPHRLLSAPPPLLLRLPSYHHRHPQERTSTDLLQSLTMLRKNMW